MKLIAACLVVLMGSLSGAQDAHAPADEQVAYSPYPEQSFPNRVFWGDTHLHTSNSADAGFLND